MPLISSYHNKLATETVYHNHSDCDDGNKIKKENKAQGTGNLLWCKNCSRLVNGRK